MKRSALGASAAVALAIALLAAPASQKDNAYPEPHVGRAVASTRSSHECTSDQFRPIARVVYQPWHEPIVGRWRLRKLKGCAQNDRTRAGMNRIQRNLAAGRFEVIANYREWTPFDGPGKTRWAVEWYIVSCESGGDFDQENLSGSGAGGAYQIMPSTWHANGGRGWHPEDAPALEQHKVAHVIRVSAGTSPWSCA